jgi:hypothetical protein
MPPARAPALVATWRRLFRCGLRAARWDMIRSVRGYQLEDNGEIRTLSDEALGAACVIVRCKGAASFVAWRSGHTAYGRPTARSVQSSGGTIQRGTQPSVRKRLGVCRGPFLNK